MVFGKPAPPKPKTNDLLPTKLANDIAESLKRILLSDDLEPLEVRVFFIEFTLIRSGVGIETIFTVSTLLPSIVEIKMVFRD